MAKVLVIDDDAAMRRLVRRILNGAGHEAVEAQDGVVGLAKFHAEAPDIVITDIIMPEREGVQTILEMRATGSQIGIIAMSGGGMGTAQLYLNIARDLGADAVLAKPFRPDELIAAVDRLLNRKPPGGAG
jgi:DNA-binding response OmpR family regulator